MVQSPCPQPEIATIGIAARRALIWNRAVSLPFLFRSMWQPTFSFKKLPQDARYSTQLSE